VNPDEAQATWDEIRALQSGEELSEDEGVEQIRMYSPPSDDESWVLLVRRNGGIVQIGPIAPLYDDLRRQLGLSVTNEEGKELHVRESPSV
jgi:hypothetical protein